MIADYGPLEELPCRELETLNISIGYSSSKCEQFDFLFKLESSKLLFLSAHSQSKYGREKHKAQAAKEKYLELKVEIYPVKKRFPPPPRRR